MNKLTMSNVHELGLHVCEDQGYIILYQSEDIDHNFGASSVSCLGDTMMPSRSE